MIGMIIVIFGKMHMIDIAVVAVILAKTEEM